MYIYILQDLLVLSGGIFGNDPAIITSNVIIPATPSNLSIPYVKRTSKQIV